ncbi:DNA-directed RNA polymerases II, IV and V subunit 3 [Camellia lanceoleosa]|uniref:DNA-directed RNA polymerases II, IV and V subunit 3 n=1 Tax=Camellia lanceoleosa TaxID=1840588 RepID=A0ACC0IQD1_9ERIC|nr:DNA-directed RNA polymerases II, IV and V subunit 3 [Camellia lanceoleosa]
MIGLAGGTDDATGWSTNEPVSSVSQEDSRSISISWVSSFQLEVPEPPEGAIILVKPSPVSTARKIKPTVKASPAEQQQPISLRAKDKARPTREKATLSDCKDCNGNGQCEFCFVEFHLRAKCINDQTLDVTSKDLYSSDHTVVPVDFSDSSSGFDNSEQRMPYGSLVSLGFGVGLQESGIFICDPSFT